MNGKGKEPRLRYVLEDANLAGDAHVLRVQPRGLGESSSAQDRGDNGTVGEAALRAMKEIDSQHYAGAE